MERRISPILITGVPRSGSSMIAEAIRLCGVFAGCTSGANESRGVCENDKIHDSIVEPYLQQIMADPKGQWPLPRMDKLSIPVDWGDRIYESILSEGYRHGPWMYKSSKIALIYPLFHYAFPNAQWIIVRRRSGDIIHSCLKTWHMKAFENPDNRKMIEASDESDGWRLWTRVYEGYLGRMIEDGLDIKVIWPERMVEGDYEQFKKAIKWLGLRWNSRVLSLIDPKLWHARREYGKGNRSRSSGNNYDFNHGSDGIY